MSDPAVSIYKGYSLRKETEEYLGCHGLKNAAYTISAVDLNENLFDNLIPCPVMVNSLAPIMKYCVCDFYYVYLMSLSLFLPYAND